MSTEETLVLVKPDGVARGLTGSILARIEAKGYALVDIRLVEPDRDRLEKHYAEHAGKPFYEPLLEFMMSGPVVVQVLERDDAVAKNRELMGATNPADAEAGTIRKEFAESIERNSVHGSDSAENAKREIDFFFKPEEIVG